MDASKKLEKSILRAISYIKNQRSNSPVSEIVNDIILSINKYLEYVEIMQSQLEIESLELQYQNQRLKNIISLYDGDVNLSNEDIEILENLKENTQFYVGNYALFTLLKYKFVDKIISIKMPEKKTRPQNLDHLNKSYQILSKKYGNPEN
jgi:hypothetical protein